MGTGQTILLGLLGFAMGFAAFVFLLKGVQYRIGRSKLRICVWGLKLRSIAYEDIEQVSKTRSRPAENWGTTLQFGHRQLVICRKTGFLREVIITPQMRYVFRNDLEEAIARWMESLHPVED